MDSRGAEGAWTSQTTPRRPTGQRAGLGALPPPPCRLPRRAPELRPFSPRSHTATYTPTASDPTSHTPGALLRTSFALPAGFRSPAGSRESEAESRRERFREVTESGTLPSACGERGLGSRGLAGSSWTATCCGSRWAATARRCWRCCGASSKTTRTSGACWARRPSQPAARRRLREPAGTRAGTRAGPGLRNPEACGPALGPGGKAALLPLNPQQTVIASPLTFPSRRPRENGLTTSSGAQWVKSFPRQAC